MKPLLDVRNLRTTFSSDWGTKEALDGVSFTISPKEILCIVGESGSGKSVTALSLMGLLPRNGKVLDGEAFFNGMDILKMSETELDEIRGGDMAMVFQDAISSLNPVFTIGNQLIEAIRAHRKMSAADAREKAVALLDRVGLPEPELMLERYPYALSGGMRQRVMIAMALAGSPKLLIADEPTTALDVTIQAQIMKLLRELVDETDLAVILITHDIGLVAQMADRVLVMYAGQIVEQSDVNVLFDSPDHPYTQGLMHAIPSIYDNKERRLVAIPGSVPENYEHIVGCRFASRCAFRVPACDLPQELKVINDSAIFPHCVRCHRAVNSELPPYVPIDVSVEHGSVAGSIGGEGSVGGVSGDGSATNNVSANAGSHKVGGGDVGATNNVSANAGSHKADSSGSATNNISASAGSHKVDSSDGDSKDSLGGAGQ